MILLLLLLAAAFALWFYREPISAWLRSDADPFVSEYQRLERDEKAAVASFGKRTTPPTTDPAATKVDKP
jgi:hypothetical protein